MTPLFKTCRSVFGSDFLYTDPDATYKDFHLTNVNIAKDDSLGEYDEELLKKCVDKIKEYLL